MALSPNIRLMVEQAKAKLKHSNQATMARLLNGPLTSGFTPLIPDAGIKYREGIAQMVFGRTLNDEVTDFAASFLYDLACPEDAIADPSAQLSDMISDVRVLLEALEQVENDFNTLNANEALVS